MSINTLNMSSAFQGLQIAFEFKKPITASDGAGGFTTTYTTLKFKGVITSPKPIDLEISQEGYRQWAKYVVHTETQISALPGDSWIYNGKSYKIIDKTDNSNYKFYRYLLIEEFTNGTN